MLDHVDPDVAELREPFREDVRRDLHARRELQRQRPCPGSAAPPASPRGTERRRRTVRRRGGGARGRRPSGPRPRAPGPSPRTAARPRPGGGRRPPARGRRRSRRRAPPPPGGRGSPPSAGRPARPRVRPGGSPARRRPSPRSGGHAPGGAARTARSRRGRRAPPGATSHLPRNANAATRTAPVAVATGHRRGDSRRRGAFRGARIVDGARIGARRRTRLPGRQPGPERVGFERLRDVEALRLVAAEVTEPVERLPVLDAFGDDPETEVAAQLHGGPDDREVLDPVEHVRHERAVDLELLDRQPLQVGERGEPGPEVVDRQAHAEPRQAVQDGVGSTRVGDEEALGQLEPEERRRTPNRSRRPLTRPRGGPDRAGVRGDRLTATGTRTP